MPSPGITAIGFMDYRLPSECETQLNLSRIERGRESQRIGWIRIAPPLHAIRRERGIPHDIINTGEIHPIEEIERLSDPLDGVVSIWSKPHLFRHTQIEV